MYVDTHCNLDDSRLEPIDKTVKEYTDCGVSIAVHMGCDLNSSIKGRELSKKYSSVYFACGYHPSEIDGFSNDAIEKLKSLSQDEKCVAIGEIGLDYHWDGYDKNKQIDGFLSHLELAKKVKLPVSIHSRDATGDMLSILKSNKNLIENGAVMHCFSGSVETARELMNLGVYIGFGGTVTFKNAVNLKQVASFVSNDFILTETDSPYLSPEPLRGTTNTPKNVALVTQYLALLKGQPTDKIASEIMANAKRLFKKIQ